MIKKILFTLLLCCSALGTAQQINLSGQAKITVLTMGPGQELYDSFGHSALRVQDTPLGIDVVYNYGVYDFNDPQFYTKFAKGNMRYLLDRRPTEAFLRAYIEDNRWVKEQVLNLTQSEVQDLFNFLENNLKPENRAYNYDFFYDNCATKIPEVIGKVIPGGIQIDSTYIKEPKTFRTLIQENVHWNTWGSFGMDLGIGSVVDRNTTPKERLFLPENVFLAFKKSTRTSVNDSNLLVKETKDLFVNNPQAPKSNFIKSPLLVMILLGGFILFITYSDSKKQQRSRWLDVSLAVITGVIGIILLLLWFGTNHSTTAYNYNILWAFPFSIFIVLQLAKHEPKRWVQGFIKFLLIMLALLCMHWIIGVQGFAFALIPLLIALTIRYVYVLRFIKQ